jgi:hypothetical protein
MATPPLCPAFFSRSRAPFFPGRRTWPAPCCCRPWLLSSRKLSPLPAPFSLRPALSIQHTPFSSMENQQRAPFLAVRRGARRLFVKMRSKPRAVGSLFRGAPWIARRRRSPCVCCFAQPIRDAVENRGEKPPLFSMFIFRCV